MTVFPSYYEEFSCIADRCRHNCCIGWEIDIDGDTVARYRALGGTLGERLRRSIEGDPPHFVIGADERCPFLNEHNLCDIICECGEDALCDICAMHPRFVNEIGERVELGIGMACEEAARIILTAEAPMRLVGAPETETDAVLHLRARLLAILQDRSMPVAARCDRMLALLGISLPAAELSQWAEELLALERLDASWTRRLEALRDGWVTADLEGFVAHMEARETEYEQLLCYFVYRYVAKARDADEAAVYGAFAALCYSLVYFLGAVEFTESGEFTVEAQIELCRAFSAEIEYSEDNVDALLQYLGT